jgi:hypothetical protein
LRASGRRPAEVLSSNAGWARRLGGPNPQRSSARESERLNGCHAHKGAPGLRSAAPRPGGGHPIEDDSLFSYPRPLGARIFDLDSKRKDRLSKREP